MSTASPSYRVIGVMSGTSLDGIDLADCYFQLDGNTWKYEIRNTKAEIYSKEWWHYVWTPSKSFPLQDFQMK